jgi:peptide/nickel transport system substrate-binding protein
MIRAVRGPSRPTSPMAGTGWRLVLPLLAVLALTATACTQVSDGDADGSGAAGGNLVFATSVDTPSLHPYTEISDARMRRSPLMYDTLVEWDRNLQIVPGLAETWDLDGTEWTFHLRKGVKFHNGKTLDAADVAYSLEQVLDSPGAGFYSAINDVEAVDDSTVRLHLKQPSGSLLAALGGRYAYIVPKGAVKEYDLNTEAVGTGVFRVAEFRQGEFLRLQKNPDHWRADEVKVDTLTIQVVKDESSIVAGLRGGTIHAAIFEDVRSADLLSGAKGITLTEGEGVRWDVLDFPLDVQPFSIPEFRQAVASAIDRDAVMKLAIGDRGSKLGVHPPALWGALPPQDAPYGNRDLDRAKQLLAKSGYSGRKLTLTSIQGYDALNAAAQVIADNLSDIGLEVTIERKELGVWIEDWNARKFNTFTMNSWSGFVDPDLLYFNHFHKQPDGKDFRRWNNDQVSALLDEARQTLERGEREKLYRQVQELIAEQVPVVPLYSSAFVGAHRDQVGNWSVHPSGHYHDLRWLTLPG